MICLSLSEQGLVVVKGPLSGYLTAKNCEKCSFFLFLLRFHVFVDVAIYF